MKKYMLDLRVTENVRPHVQYCLLKLTSEEELPDMLPGQFVEVRVDHSSSTFLRRPISINFVDRAKNELWLLIQLVGDGTRQLAEARVFFRWVMDSRCLMKRFPQNGSCW